MPVAITYFLHFSGDFLVTARGIGNVDAEDREVVVLGSAGHPVRRGGDFWFRPQINVNGNRDCYEGFLILFVKVVKGAGTNQTVPLNSMPIAGLVAAKVAKVITMLNRK